MCKPHKDERVRQRGARTNTRHLLNDPELAFEAVDCPHYDCSCVRCEQEEYRFVFADLEYEHAKQLIGARLWDQRALDAPRRVLS